MRTKRLFLSFTLLLAAGVAFTFLTSMSNNADVILKSKNSIKNFLKNHSTISEIFFDIEAPKDGNGKVNTTSGHKVKKSPATQMNWTEMGPSNVGGRTRAVVIDKDNQNLIIAGSVGGGIWKSTTGGLSWVKIAGNDLLDNMIISSMCQASNGDIYAGTGEYFNLNNKLGFRGQGIWKSTDHGETWTHLTSTWNSSDDSKNIFYYVSKIAIHPTNTNKIYAATAKGLMLSTDGGTTWANTIAGDANADSVCTDVQVSKDGLVVIAALARKAYVCNTGDDSFKNISDKVTPVDSIPTDVRRIEFAIAPSNSNYIYCLAADNAGALKNVYQSTDKGNTFTKMLASINSQFLPFGEDKYGRYNNVIAVFPDDPEHLLLGGYDLFEYTTANPWQQVSTGLLNFTNQKYVHSGIHTIVFAPNYSATNKVIYLGTDGGVFSSADAALTWSQKNKNYNTTIFNSVSYSINGMVIGGTQNNGTEIIPLTGTHVTDAFKIYGGNGGHCEFSQLNPYMIFATTSFGKLIRSNDGGGTFETDNTKLISKNITDANTNIGTSTHPFVTPIRLWETFYDPGSWLYWLAKAPETLYLGDTLSIFSQCGRELKHIINLTDLNGRDSLRKSDTVVVQDTYQSVLAIGYSGNNATSPNGSIWITRFSLLQSMSPPIWYRISKLTTVKEIQNIEFSKDGDHLFFSDYNATTGVSKIYRCSNINSAKDSATCASNSSQQVITTTEIGNFDHKITGIAIDPQNANNVVLTLGGYTSTDYIYYSFNAATTTSSVTADNFASRQSSSLPAMPIYSAIVNWNNSLVVIIGTESGVYTTDDITVASPTWEKQTAFPNVPVIQLRQQIHPNGWYVLPVVDGGFNSNIENHGVIYAATAGRGIYRCEDFRGPVSVPEIVENKSNSLQIVVYPNPVKDQASVSFNLNKRSDVIFKIYDLSGNVVKTISSKNQDAGNHSLEFDTYGLSAGTYIASMESNGTKSTTKFVVY
ncbi:MAG: T9SS type A sorting domain-containing protein [Bacteroidia bacterium]|nr:T9SS type A sorting domain-containing protein [Bacteroidia bacterium]